MAIFAPPKLHEIISLIIDLWWLWWGVRDYQIYTSKRCRLGGQLGLGEEAEGSHDGVELFLGHYGPKSLGIPKD